METAWGPPAFYAACLAYALGGDTGAEGSWGLPTGAEAWRGVTPERLSVALAAAVRNTDVLVDEQRIPAADVMLAGLRFVRQGERARLEVNNLPILARGGQACRGQFPALRVHAVLVRV